ncbi:MAG: tetratricopeptide repeat protein [Bacillota bacterium]|nr:tetratricopeptide repeat protein [Bacillota bacterium]
MISIKSIYEKAIKHLEVGELDEAEEALQLYLRDNPSDAMAYNKLGVVFVKRPNRSEAKRCFQEALKYDVKLVPALNNLGNIAREEGELEQAIEYYRKAILIDPDYPLPHNNLSVVYKQLGRYKDFVREIKTAKRLENRNVLQPKKKQTMWSLLARIWTKKRDER